MNFRLLPGDTKEQVMDHVRIKVAQATQSENFELLALPGAVNASKVASTESAQYKLLNKTIREVFPDALVAPGLMIGGTDSIHYGEISGHIFKFSPVRANSQDLKRFHGTNERLGVDNYADAIRFYHRPGRLVRCPRAASAHRARPSMRPGTASTPLSCCLFAMLTSVYFVLSNARDYC